ncbi:hypothetical protein BKP44_15990 [Formosa algae]|nr:hypothetical protein BKP44_15990 [Formosa algae]
MLFWGWFEFLCFFANIEYPYYIFDHIGMSRNGILVTNGFPRMISVTLEASYLAQILIPIIPFFYWFGQSKSKFIYSTWFYKILYLISIITLLVAQTSTGILGFLLVMGLLLKNKISSYKKSIRLVFIFIFIIICIVGLFFAVNLIIKKSNNYSGIERLKTVILGFEYFLHYPILGLGWGVFPTYDFIVNLLANFGLVGTIPFFIFLRNIYMSFKQKIKIEESKMYKAGFESFILILIVSQLSGFIYHSQYFWIYIGVAFCISSMHNKKLVS